MWTFHFLTVAALLTATKAANHTLQIETVAPEEDKSVWMAIGLYSFFTEEGHLHTTVPMPQCAAAVKAVTTLTKVISQITGVTTATVCPQAVEIDRLLDQVELLTSKGPFDRNVSDAAHTKLIQQFTPGRNKRDVQEFFNMLRNDDAFDLISSDNHHFAVDIPASELFTAYDLFQETATYTQQALNYSKNVTHDPDRVSKQLTIYLKQIAYTGFFDRAYEFLHGVLSLFQKRLSPKLFNPEKAKEGIDALSLKVKEDTGKSLVSNNIHEALAFPFSFIANGDTLHLILSIPITTQPPAHALQLMKKDYFFTQNDQPYKYTIESHFDIITTPQQNTAILMQASDLENCFKYQKNHFCPTQPHAADLHSTCLAAIYTFNADAILQNCQISITKISSSAYIHLYDNKYQIIAHTPTTLTYECEDRSLSQALTLNKVYQITLDEFCNSLRSSHFSVATDVTGPPRDYPTRSFFTNSLTQRAFQKHPSSLQGSFTKALTRTLSSLSEQDPWHVDANEAMTIIMSALLSAALVALIIMAKLCIHCIGSRGPSGTRVCWKRGQSPLPPYIP